MITSFASLTWADSLNFNKSDKYKKVLGEKNIIEISPEIENRISSIMEHINSEAWKDNQARLTLDIKRTLNLDSVLDENEPTVILTEDRIVLFVSESIPLSVLRVYAKDIAKINGVMVFRGLRGGVGKIQPSVQMIGDIIKKDPSCKGPQCVMLSTNVIIDPLLFRASKVSKVPAAIFQQDMNLASYCERKGADTMPKKANHIVYGDASLKGLIKELFYLSKDPNITPFLKQLDEINDKG